MLSDTFGRHITYLRLSVTERCNYRCLYCMPPAQNDAIASRPALNPEQMIKVIYTAGSMGITKIKFTGGEPLVFIDIDQLVEAAARSGFFTDIGMTTNAALLSRRKAKQLREAGLNRVNISLDSIDPDRFSMLTRGGQVEDVFRGIDAALEAELLPVKINMVVFPDTHPDEIEELRLFCLKRKLILQTIRHFSLHQRCFSVNQGTDRPQPCEWCNRIRITADGFLKPCLHSDEESQVDFYDVENCIRKAVENKPAFGGCCSERTMNQIGG